MKKIILILATLLLTGCQNLTMPNIEQMMVNLNAQIPDLWRLATAFAYVFGVMCFLRAMYQLKIYGEMRVMMSSNANIKGPLVLFLTGAALLFFPTIKSSVLMSTFGYGEQQALAYQSGTDLLTPAAFQAMLGIVQFVGVVAFIRGWVILSHSANPSGQSQFGKAMTHIVGGILAINIQGTINAFALTLGVNSA